MCDILSAISYGLYPQHHQHIQTQTHHHNHHPELLRPFKKLKKNMTIPSRPAPPPPQASSNRAANRYSPATNWDDTPFGSSAVAPQVKKAPPPRPPPPKVVPALKKPGQAQSINILSNLFGQKRAGSTNNKPPVSQKPVLMKLPPPPKLPPPNGYGSLATTTSTVNSELISFDSPPSSPTFTQKSCSDCISVDSFSSDSNYSSPNNGNMSQAESGFEDDFVVTEHGRRSKVTTPSSTTISTSSSSRDLWDLSDPFGMPGTTNSNNAHYAPVGSATIRVPTVNSKLYETEFVDPLCNGKTVAPKVQTIAKPTIIKTVASATSSQKSTPVHHHLELKPKPVLTPPVWSIKPAAAPPTNPPPHSTFDDEESSSLDSLPSLPMPNIPPPPPPVVVEEDVDVVGTVPEPVVEEQHQEAYGVAMYDFNGETDEDLSFRTNDKIYLLKRLNEEWLLGRDRRGCEGMFPANYIEVRIALPGDNQQHHPAQSSTSKSVSPVASSFNPPKVRALYTFNAETAEDLTIVENDFITVLHQINAEWLFGESHGQRGQFPANFIEYVPSNLPLVPPPQSGH